jgi:hypothetical protein
VIIYFSVARKKFLDLNLSLSRILLIFLFYNHNYSLDEIVLSKSHGNSNIEVYLVTNEKSKAFTGIEVEDEYKKIILRNLKSDRYR